MAYVRQTDDAVTISDEGGNVRPDEVLVKITSFPPSGAHAPHRREVGQRWDYVSTIDENLGQVSFYMYLL